MLERFSGDLQILAISIPIVKDVVLAESGEPYVAAAIASSFSPRLPLKETVAIEVFMAHTSVGEWAASAPVTRPITEHCGRIEGAVHAAHVGHDPCEQPEGFRCLVYAHARTIDDTRTFGASSRDQLGLERGVDHIGHPMPALHGMHRDGIAREAAHSDGSGVDHARYFPERQGWIGFGPAPLPAQFVRERLGTCGVPVIDDEMGRTQVEKCKRHGPASASGADEQHGFAIDAAKRFLEAAPEADPVGVVAPGAAVVDRW